MFGRKRKASDFGAEIEAHIQLEAERLREQGLSEEEARATNRRIYYFRSSLPAATIANVSLRDQQQRGWEPLNPARLLRFYDSSC
jgi:hypothetical protein